MVSRRLFLGGLGAILAQGAKAQNGPVLIATELGLDPLSRRDQSQALQQAINRAVEQGQTLFLPAGQYLVQDIDLPAGGHILGVRGKTQLQLSGGKTIFQAVNVPQIGLDGLSLSGETDRGEAGNTGLIDLQGCQDIRIENCTLSNSAINGVNLFACSGRIRDTVFENINGAAIASRDGAGLWIKDNDISNCGNLGIYVERAEPAFDGSIIMGNRISDIDWRQGGNGQNGNGINVFRANGVIVANNIMSGCSFSAVRLNATHDCQVTGNICRNSGEVAIFSEFGFSGSVIANNIVDGAAQGISITNLDSGGRLAVCNGNIVRNIAPESLTNPDTTPVGIAVEADTVVTSNVVENVPGIGISMGWGPYMRNLTVDGNVIRACAIAIGISVVDGIGEVTVSDNMIQRQDDALAIAAMAWAEVVARDMIRSGGDFPMVQLSNNRVSG